MLHVIATSQIFYSAKTVALIVVINVTLGRDIAITKRGGGTVVIPPGFARLPVPNPMHTSDVQNGTYPPLGGANPTQGGVYYPQGGANPPQDGSYPPQGGAYPPHPAQPGYVGYIPPQPGYSPAQPPPAYYPQGKVVCIMQG